MILHRKDSITLPGMYQMLNKWKPPLLSLNSIPDRNLWKDSFMHNYSKTCSSQVKQQPSFDSPLCQLICDHRAVFTIYRGWCHILQGQFWRADRPEITDPSERLPLFFLHCHQLFKNSECLSYSCQTSSVWDCSGFYCLVLFTVLVGHTHSLCVVYSGRDMSPWCVHLFGHQDLVDL